MYTIDHAQTENYLNASFDSLLALKKYLVEEAYYSDVRDRKLIVYENGNLLGTIFLVGDHIAIDFFS